MKKLIFLLITIFSFTCFDLSKVCLAQKKEKLKATGEVVGFDRFASLTNITSAPQSRTLIVKLNKLIKGKQSHPYTIVVYKSWGGEPLLPEEMFNGKSKWKFKLTSENSCDSTWKDITSLENSQENQDFKGNSRFEWIPVKPDVADNANLPCYIFGYKDYKMIK
jgi:hypothetical protein